MFALRKDAHRAISESFQWTHQPVDPGLSVRVEDTHEVQAHGFRDSGQRDHKEAKLNPAIHIHPHSSKFLRAKHCYEQVDEKPQGYRSYNPGFHGLSS